LTHRTLEIKASSEPKEQQIENLKEHLLDLEKMYELQKKATKAKTEDGEKIKANIDELKKLLNREKYATKAEEKKISQFVNKIAEIVQNKEQKSYIDGLMKIYKMYVKEYSDEILEKKKKDPEMIEELNRQLIYMEKSINSLKLADSKN